MATRRPVLRGGQASEKNSVVPLQVADLTGGKIVLNADAQSDCSAGGFDGAARFGPGMAQGTGMGLKLQSFGR